MTPEQLRQDIQKLKKRPGQAACFIEVPETCCLQWPPRVERPADAEQLRQLIEAFQPREGWICWQNDVTHFPPGAPEYPPDKHLLYAEFANADASLHVNEDGQGGWIVTWFKEGAGEAFAVTETRFMGERLEDMPDKLWYRVYWQDTGQWGFRQIAARFGGFLSLKGKS